jgi:hypothetical protein
MINTIDKQGNNMPDNDAPGNDWDENQPTSKIRVKTSNKYKFGENTLTGLTLIIITLTIQLIFIIINVIDLSEPNEEMTLSDFENAAADIEMMMTIQLVFSILFISVQIVGLMLIWNDVNKLSRSLNRNVNIRNENLITMAKAINKK